MNNKKVICVIVGIFLIIVGIIGVIYAQNEISSSWGYTWTQPYSDFESKIITIKNLGIASLVFGVIDIAIVGFSNLFKKSDQ
ncbi:MAG: hypothetical protein ACI4W6_07690 [Acutalibacteraceae bacterium]